MHVALLSHEYPPFTFGGVGTFVRDLAQGLYSQGLDVTVISGYPVPSMHEQQFDICQERKDEVRIIKLPYANIPPRHLLFQILNFKRLHKIIKKINVDVIHGQSGSTFPALFNLKHLAPIVVTFHSSPKMQLIMSLRSVTRGGGFGDFYTFALGYHVWTYAYKKEFRNSSVAVTVSETLMRQLMLEMDGKHERKISCVHNGVDVEMLDKGSSNAYRDEEEEKDPTILFGGRLYWAKGVLHLLKLACLLRKRHNFNWKIVIYGEGPLRTKIKKNISDYGLNNVAIRGLVNRDDFINEMRKATFVVVPSVDEACPMVLLESMCLGKVPVLFNLPYALEFTENGKYGVVANDLEDMATRIESTYKDVDMEHLGNAIKSFATRKYNILNVASKYIDLYKEVVN